MIKLLMLSGGFDSCALLIKELKENNDEIHVHHITLINLENRYEAENKATSKIIEYCRKIRNFDFSSSEYNCSFSVMAPDVVIVAFIGSQVGSHLLSVQSKTELKILMGVTTSDANNRWYETERAQVADKIVKAYCFIDNSMKAEIVYPFLNENKSKSDILKYIPNEFRKNLFTCRNPIKVGDKFIACNGCHSCRALKEAYRRE